MILKNDRVTVEVSDPHSFSGTRFDYFPAVKQITLDGKHTFLGFEKTKNGLGTQGFGLQCGYLWADKAFPNRILNQTGLYPILGVGKLNLKGGEQYSIRENYAHIPCIIDIEKLSEHSLYSTSIDEGIARITKKIELTDRLIKLSTKIQNLSDDIFSFEEYCHNFILFDSKEISDSYKVSLNYNPSFSIVRGNIEVGTNWFRPKQFDETLETIALITKDYDELVMSRVIISNLDTKTFITCYDSFPTKKTYHWISPFSLCPENYFIHTLEPEGIISFSRCFEIGYC